MHIEPENQDGPDPMRTAFDDHQRAPRDIVPYTEQPGDDLLRLAADGAPVEVTHYSITGSGIERHVERITITAPFTRKDTNNL